MQVLGAAVDDHVDARLGGVEHAAGPARRRGSPAGGRPAPRTGCGSRAGCERAAAACAPTPTRPPPRSSAAGGRSPWAVANSHDRVVVAVAGELVALRDDPLGELGVRVQLTAQAEERRLHAGVACSASSTPGVYSAVGPSSNVIGDQRVGRVAATDHLAEDARVGRERAPRPRHRGRARSHRPASFRGLCSSCSPRIAAITITIAAQLM